MADAGTGSGCIAISVLTNFERVQCIATDLSTAALQIAKRNGQENGVLDRFKLLKCDLLKGIAKNSLDLIFSNPPYIPSCEIPILQEEVRDWEPRMALDGGPDGLTLYRRLAELAESTLAPGGWLGVENGCGQSDSVAEIFENAGFINISKRRDLAGIERIVIAQKKDIFVWI